jgi:AraC-like DNA-binding protein
MQIASPDPILAPYTRCFWGMEQQVPRGGDYVHRIVPSGMSELMFYLGDLPLSLDKRKSITGHSLLSGQQKEYYDIQISGTLSLFSIIFQPHGLMVFFDLPLDEIFNRNVPLSYVLKDVVSELEDSLHQAADFRARQKVAETFLRKRLKDSKRKYEYERIHCAIELIRQSGVQVSIDQLASHVCLSRRQFERSFREHVGSSPGQFLRTLRFQKAIHEKARDPGLNLTELTYASGYYDQSHMNAEFRRLAGMTPGQYFASCEPYSDYFG